MFTSALLLEVFSVAAIMTDGHVEEDPMYGLQGNQTSILLTLLVGTPKTSVYAAPVDNEEAFHRRITVAYHIIRNYPGIFERMRRFVMRRVETCIESYGGHFEHFMLNVPFQL
jgi:hypothetical protein